MEAKRFHIGDVMSVILNRIVSVEGVKGIQDFLEYMTGKNVWIHQIPRAAEVCKPYILSQLPELDTPEISVLAHGELILMVEGMTDDDMKHKMVLGWLSSLSAKYGEEFLVKPLPEDVYDEGDPVAEYFDSAGSNSKIIILET